METFIHFHFVKFTPHTGWMFYDSTFHTHSVTPVVATICMMLLKCHVSKHSAGVGLHVKSSTLQVFLPRFPLSLKLPFLCFFINSFPAKCTVIPYVAIE